MKIISSKTKYYFNRLTTAIKSRPLTVFFTCLGILLALIVVGNIVRKANIKPPKIEPTPAKAVQLFTAGSAPMVRTTGTVQKSGIVKISALSGGIVNSIAVKEGQEVKAGTVLASLGSNYSGASAQVIQRQLADKQLSSAVLTLNSQKEIIAKQKDAASLGEVNAEQMREIARQSVGETQDLIHLNEEIITHINTGISNLYQGGVGESDPNYQQLQSAKSQVQAGLNQLRSGLRTAEYQSDDSKPPADLATIQKDITLKQLELQEKSLGIAVDVAKLQVQLAKIAESTLYPTSPVNGVVQKVYVNKYDSVSPGTPIAEISSGSGSIKVTALVSREIAQKVSTLENSILYFDNSSVQSAPIYVAQEATDGQSYAVTYTIDANNKVVVNDKSSIRIDMPLGFSSASDSTVYVPIDSVYQSQDKAYVFIKEGKKAMTKTITLGDVYGSFVAVKDGLKTGDQVIVNRNVVNGDKVE